MTEYEMITILARKVTLNPVIGEYESELENYQESSIFYIRRKCNFNMGRLHFQI